MRFFGKRFSFLTSLVFLLAFLFLIDVPVSFADECSSQGGTWYNEANTDYCPNRTREVLSNGDRFCCAPVTYAPAFPTAGERTGQTTGTSCAQSGGSCQNYSAGASCGSGRQWDFSLSCPESQGDLRCCKPTSTGGGSTGGNTGGNGGSGSNNGTQTASAAGNDPYGNSYGDTGTGGGGWDQGIETAGSASGLPRNDVQSLLLNFMKWLLLIFVILAFIAFIISGVMFLMAGADKNMAEKAKTGVTYSIIALVVTFSAFIIITLINELLQGGWMF